MSLSLVSYFSSVDNFAFLLDPIRITFFLIRFCDVGDVLDGLVRFMASDMPEPINIGNPEEIALGVLTEEIIRLADSISTMVHRPLSANDPARRRPDISKAKECLEWSPIVSLESRLKATISYFREKLATTQHAR